MFWYISIATQIVTDAHPRHRHFHFLACCQFSRQRWRQFACHIRNNRAVSHFIFSYRFINTILTIVIKGGNLSFFRCFCCRNNTCKKNCYHTCHQPFCNSSYIFHHLITFLLSIIFLSAFCPINAQNMYHHMSIVTLHKKRIVILCKIKWIIF